jgi:hypothetical protein
VEEWEEVVDARIWWIRWSRRRRRWRIDLNGHTGTAGTVNTGGGGGGGGANVILSAGHWRIRRIRYCYC